MARKVTQIVENQIRAWRRQKTLQASSDKQEKKFPVITISREFGSPGAALAGYLGEKMGFNVWDQELLVLIAQELGSDQKFVETLDERRQRVVEDAVAAFLTNVHTNVNYLHALIRVVRTIEVHGSGIIVGRGSNFICESPQVLNVRLVGPLKYRINYYANRFGITREEAGKLAGIKDKERSEFISSNFQKDVSDPLGYDLVINSSFYDLEQLSDIVMRAYEIKTGMIPVMKEAS
ncbi:MAG: cytidylate kinase-like family protein [Balneolaceae bacterium]|nr:MAG: cytidylate kinase-like family protein [Balneolaceae bacterium]